MENDFEYLSTLKPNARAEIKGGKDYPEIEGSVLFFNLGEGVVVMADIGNLPKTETNIFAFHIHEGERCDDNFSITGGHFNPTNQPHPNHAGDMPPLFSNNGNAWLAFFTQRFNLDEIINRTVVIHDSADDFSTQPAGNSGEKIACGTITKL